MGIQTISYSERKFDLEELRSMSIFEFRIDMKRWMPSEAEYTSSFTDLCTKDDYERQYGETATFGT